MHLDIFAARQFFPEKRMQKATPGGTRPQDAGSDRLLTMEEAVLGAAGDLRWNERRDET